MGQTDSLLSAKFNVSVKMFYFFFDEMGVISWVIVIKKMRSQKHNSFAIDALFAGRFDGLKSILF